jgi:hypothetical protein
MSKDAVVQLKEQINIFLGSKLENENDKGYN